MRRRCCSRHMHTAGFWSYPQAGSGPEPLKDSVKNESLSKLSRSKSDFFDIFSRACKHARWVNPRDSVCDPPIVGCVTTRRQIGRASSGGRVCEDGERTVGDGTIKQKQKRNI